MKSLIFTNNGDTRVEFVVDLINENAGNLTVMEVKGIDTVAEEALLSGFRQLPYTLEAFKKFAADNNLLLIKLDQDSSETAQTTTTTTEAPTTTTTTITGG